MYGKPVLPASGGQQTVGSDNAALTSGFCASDSTDADGSFPGNSEAVPAGDPAAERATPRPLSPTKLLPFLSNPLRNPSDADLENVRRRLHHAPRPLKKRNSITEPEGPTGPNIQKLLYQKTTLAAMETIPMETVGPAGTCVQSTAHEDRGGGGDVTSPTQPANSPEKSLTPPPLPPRLPIPDPAFDYPLPPPPEDMEDISAAAHKDLFPEEFPPYPPPPYPSCGEAEQAEDMMNLKPPEVMGQVTVPPVSVGTMRQTS